MSKIKVIWKAMRAVVQATPLFAAIELAVLGLAGILPYLLTVTSAQLFDSVNAYLAGAGTKTRILEYGAAYLALFLVQFSLETVQSVAENYGIYEKTMYELRIQLGMKYARLPLISYEDAQIHNLAQRAKECVQTDVLPGIFLSGLKAVSAVISVVSITVGLAAYSPALLPLSLFCVAPYLISRIVRGKAFYCLKVHQAPQKRKAEYLWKLFSDAAAAKEMRVMGSSGYITEKWRNTQWEVNRDLWEFNRKDSRSLLCCNLIKSAGFIMSFLLCLSLLLYGRLSVGIFGACILAISNVQAAAKNLMIELGRIPQCVSFAGDYMEFLKLPEEEDGSLEKEDFARISFEHVSFSYPNAEKWAVEDVSFSIGAGEKVVVVGRNGSGKTTLAKLMLGLYRAGDGMIRYDAANVEEMARGCLYRSISAVPQDFMKCSLTLRENVAISDVEELHNDQKIRQCLRQIGFEKECVLDRQIGREFSGIAFSGGEWQRIAIARAMFKKSSFVLLDEPTSALDPLAETEILKSFLELSRNRTAVIISHRVGLCRYADKILVMEKGKLAECGTYEQLMEQKGVFFQIFQAQAHWYEDRQDQD